MVWNKNYGEEGEDKTAVFDLRQIYAQDLVGQTLKEIQYARKTSNFPVWFKLLKRDLYADLHQKLKEKEKIEYKKKLNETLKIISQYPADYLGNKNSAEGSDIIENAIFELELFLKELIEKHKLYGAKEEAELI